MTKYNDTNKPAPKSRSIEQLVTISNDIKKVIEGNKTATRRNDRYADVDEVMHLEGNDFIITNVYQQKLGDMTDSDAVQEGYSNLDEYMNFILSIHPGMKWIPEQKVWVHEYKSIAK